MSLPFIIETRGDISVLCWPDGSCRPASTPEQQMWCELKRLEGLITDPLRIDLLLIEARDIKARRIRGEKS